MPIAADVYHIAFDLLHDLTAELASISNLACKQHYHTFDLVLSSSTTLYKVESSSSKWCPFPGSLDLSGAPQKGVTDCHQRCQNISLWSGRDNYNALAHTKKRLKLSPMHYGLRQPMGFKMCEKLSKVDAWFSLILTPTTKKMVPLSLKWPKFCVNFLGAHFRN